MSWKNWLLAVGVCILLILTIVCNRNAKTAEQSLQSAQTQLFMDAPEIAAMWERVTKDYPVEIKAGMLPEGIEGQTYIYENSAYVTIDVNKVSRVMDRLEPVLAHELYHINDARFKWGIAAFQAQVANDRNMPWERRQVELSAIQQEDALRKRLIETNERYSKMAATRAEQIKWSSRFIK